MPKLSLLEDGMAKYMYLDIVYGFSCNRSDKYPLVFLVITCIFRMNVSWMKSFLLCPVYWERKLLLIYQMKVLEPVFPVIPPNFILLFSVFCIRGV